MRSVRVNFSISYSLSQARAHTHRRAHALTHWKTRSQAVNSLCIPNYIQAQSLLIRDIVIKSPPSNPPMSVIVLKSLLQTRFKVKASAHVHSDVKKIEAKLKAPFKQLAR